LLRANAFQRNSIGRGVHAAIALVGRCGLALKTGARAI